MKRYLLPLLLPMCISTNAQAAFLFFTDRASFDASYSGLTFEDFNDLNSTFADPLVGISEPLSSSMGIFNSGTIEPGLDIATVLGTGLVWAEPTWDAGLGPVNSTNFFGTNQNVDGNGLKLSFSNANAVGFDVYSLGDLGSGNPIFDITVFDTVGGVLGLTSVTAPLTGQFFGVASSTQIGRIEAIAPGSRVELFDNIAFGAATVVPIPAAVWLFGSGLLGLVGIARRRAA